VEPRDEIIVFHYPSDQYGTEWVFGSFVRFDTLLIFGAAFFVLLLIFGRAKGLSTIISLTFTCMAIYLSTLVTCAFITIMTIIITNRWSTKTTTTILGCLFGVFVAALLSLIPDGVLQLTGITDDH